MPKYKSSTNIDPLKATFGENSQGVGALQAQLNQKYAGQAGFPLKVDNKFGPLTQAAMNFKPTTTANKNTPIGQISTVGMDNGNDYYGSIMEKQARGEDIVDTGRIRSDILSRFQDRINATNDIYNRQLAAARQEGVGRVGSGTSLLAARGLTGSMRGGAIKENILDQDRQIEGAIDAERNAAIQNILGMAEQSAIEEAARRREAIQSGASNYINYVKSQGETKRSNLENVAGQLIAQGIDPSTMNADELSTVAKQLGVSTNDIISSYKQKEFEQKQLDAKAQQDAYKALPASAQEYEYAKKGGYTGSFTQYQNEDANRKASAARSGGSGTGASSNQFSSDLDAIIGNTVATIPSKFGQEQFNTQIKRSRNDADKISTVAAVVLKNAPSEVKNDFANQAIGVSNIDKAIKLIDEKAKTGVINNAKQYVFNLVGKDYDPNLAAISAYITSAVQPYRNSVTGAAWGDQEEGEYASLFGSTKYSPTELKDRLTRIKQVMKDKSAQGLNVYVNPLDTYSNVFSGGSSTAAPAAQSQGSTVTVYSIKTGKPAQIPQASLQQALSSGLFRQ